ncbi:MAG TPA: DUF4105 domain-containing protein [Candidatus Woesebacteria bacterium]|nr:DUF4105 domain-containing protein [Candidatus Woesebacteria bacterium]
MHTNLKKIYIVSAAICLLVFYLVYIFAFLQPQNDRNWEVGFEKLPHIDINNDQVTITNVRDYKYKPGRFVSAGYINRQVDISKLKQVWFVVEPFEGFPLIKFDGIAHTYFVFDFEDQKPIVISVEARREKEEKFGLFSGMLNKFELMYVWGTEEDLTQRRVLIEDNSLYMYPLTISQEQVQRLFLQLAKTTQELETKPRFYNSLFSNCTNELAKNANTSKPGTIPYNLTWFFPGLAPQLLYKLQFIPTDKPLKEISKQYYISDLVKQYYNKPDFSTLLRQNLLP